MIDSTDVSILEQIVDVFEQNQDKNVNTSRFCNVLLNAVGHLMPLNDDEEDLRDYVRQVYKLLLSIHKHRKIEGD
jgi:hypothetical protein